MAEVPPQGGVGAGLDRHQRARQDGGGNGVEGRGIQGLLRFKRDWRYSLIRQPLNPIRYLSIEYAASE